MSQRRALSGPIAERRFLPRPVLKVKENELKRQKTNKNTHLH